MRAERRDDREAKEKTKTLEQKAGAQWLYIGYLNMTLSHISIFKEYRVVFFFLLKKKKSLVFVPKVINTTAGRAT